MKTSRIAIATASLLSIFLIAPASALIFASPTWQGFTFHGSDNFYDTTITGFKTGTTATFTLTISNTFGDYLNVTGDKLVMDWNGNYTTPNLNPSNGCTNCIRVNGGAVIPVTITFTVPATTTATNLVLHDYTWSINYTRSSTPSTPRQLFGSGDAFAVLSSDQADALTAMQQIPSGAFCGSFRTAEGSTLCQQSQQQQALASSLYSAGDFTNAKNDFQTALNDWNQALSADKSTGGNLELAGTVQGWGFLLLGIGALVAGIGGILYAWKRPRELRGMAPATATH